MANEKNVSEVSQAAHFSQEGRDRLEQLAIESAELDKQIKEQKLLSQKQELEDLKVRNADAEQRRAINRVRLANEVARDTQRFEKEARIKAVCNHTQGGEGIPGLYEGDGIQTTFQKETDVLNRESFRCIRCCKRVKQEDEPAEFLRIKRLPHKGLVGPVPITFKFVDGNGNQVALPAIFIAE